MHLDQGFNKCQLNLGWLLPLPMAIAIIQGAKLSLIAFRSLASARECCLGHLQRADGKRYLYSTVSCNLKDQAYSGLTS